MQDVIFRIANEEERVEAVRLTDEWGWQLFGCKPPPLLGNLVIAYHKEKGIIGTLAFGFTDERTPFSLEALYDFSVARQQLPPFTRENTVQAVRWFARMPGVSYKLFQALADYVKPRGIQFIIFDAKDYAIKRLEELGLKLFIVSDVLPNITEVPSEGRRFYELPPLPQLVLVDIPNSKVMSGTPILARDSMY